MINATMVKELRDASGVGMMDAKKALVETGGDMEAALDWLRSKGLSKAAKKSGRVAAEGLVCIKVSGGESVVIEVNSETDFVAKNSEFQDMVMSIADNAMESDDIKTLLSSEVGAQTVQELISEKVSKIGENMTLRRVKKLSGSHIYSYVHNASAKDMGKIAVLVNLSNDNSVFGKQVAMHIAATNPASLSENDLNEDLIQREKAILTEQARESGKPENIIENMIKGRLKKYYEEITLLNQKFVMDTDITVRQAAKKAGSEIVSFVRLEVGEGIEKKEENFAAEVKKTING